MSLTTVRHRHADIITNDTRGDAPLQQSATMSGLGAFHRHVAKASSSPRTRAGRGANPVLTLADSCAGGSNPLLAEVQAAAGDTQQ